MSDEPLQAEADRLFDKNRTLLYMDALGITAASVRAAMLAEPGRARAVMRRALDDSALASPAGWAIGRFRDGYDPRSAGSGPASSPRPELVEATPTLSTLEYMLGLGRSPWLDDQLQMACTAIGRNGGFTPILEAGWWEHETYDALLDHDLIPVEHGDGSQRVRQSPPA